MKDFDTGCMMSPAAYDHQVKGIELIETHISWVFLTGEFAYKVKKPVNFGFLDFSTLEKRRICCEQEVGLNRRLAPAIYLDVVSITGTNKKPVISGGGEVFEYAVKMKQFPQSCQLDHMLAAGELKAKHMDGIARMVADFHQRIQVADSSMHYGDKDAIYRPVEENFIQISEHLDTSKYTEDLEELQQWSSSTFDNLVVVFEQRKRDGYVRECHGDMHLRNLIWLDSMPMAFDCIEFNPQLRWIDVISEIAFLIMDLQDRNQYQLANRFLNTYLEVTGDYAGLSVLPYYLCYRALVRAKVDVLRLEQKNISEEEGMQVLKEFESYIELAKDYAKQSVPKLIIMRGLSASGKSTVSQQVLDAIGAIRVRSDVERKRLFNISITADASSEIDNGIYTTQASQKTYARLVELASQVISAGYSVIVDAAFLEYEQRKPFQVLANNLNSPYIILEVTAPEEVLRQRIAERRNDVSDADIRVLEHQLSKWKTLHSDEVCNAIPLNSAEKLDLGLLIETINSRIIN